MVPKCEVEHSMRKGPTRAPLSLGQKADSARAGRVAIPPAAEEVLEEPAEELAFLLWEATGAAEELMFWYWGMAWAIPAVKAMAATMLLKEGIFVGLKGVIIIRILLVASVVEWLLNEWTAEA
jgi:hypothetical protein